MTSQQVLEQLVTHGTAIIAFGNLSGRPWQSCDREVQAQTAHLNSVYHYVRLLHEQR